MPLYLQKGRYGNLGQLVRVKVENGFGYRWDELTEERKTELNRVSRAAHDKCCDDDPVGNTLSERVNAAIESVLGTAPAIESGMALNAPKAPPAPPEKPAKDGEKTEAESKAQKQGDKPAPAKDTGSGPRIPGK